MKATNLYLLTRIHSNPTFDIIANHSSGNSYHETKPQEIVSLQLLVDKFIEMGVTIELLDGFFFGFKIPQIGKEFDLLKITQRECLNIELKSQSVPIEKIKKQLIKNKFYLSHLGKSCRFYTVVTDSFTCYQLDESDNLTELSIVDIAEMVKYLGGQECILEIESLFKVSDYLISPLNTPEKFIHGQYFLTQQQERIKNSIINSINTRESQFYSITGKPGTGKTLLLYDIAKKLSEVGKTAIIHCGKLSEGQCQLNEMTDAIHIIPIQTFRYDSGCINEYKYILVDEAHRIFSEQLDTICEIVQRDNKVGVFSLDPEQVLSSKEERSNIIGKILELPLINKYELSEKIRTNEELSSFITNMRDLKNKSHVYFRYNNITITYANDVSEAEKIIEYYRNQGYTFINYSKSNRRYSPFSKYEEDFDTHHVIGQEFDKVLMLLDDSFYYNEKGILCAKEHPNPDYLYPKLFYQGITRAREKIALIVVNAPMLFEQITSILTNQGD